jgi:hypothetical protein
MPGSVVLLRVKPDHPPGVIPHDPGAGDAGGMGGGRPAGRGHRAAPRRAAAVFLLVLGCALAGVTAGVVLIDAALIAAALWVVAAPAHGARRPAS